jgi:WhiB family redox-sensing transcriptional regulator
MSSSGYIEHSSDEEVTTMTDFREMAECRDVDPELFFPVGAQGARLYDAQVARAKAVCAGCPVRRECLLYALNEGLVYGVYGGTDGPERAGLLRSLPRAVSA